MSKDLGQRTDAELAALFGDMYVGWDRGVNVTQERFGDGETRFTETPMTPLELAARYVAAELGVNIYEIANRAAFAPITVFSQIQARIGPVFSEMADALEAKDAEIAEWQQAASDEAYLHHKFLTRALKAEADLAEALKVIELFANHWIGWGLVSAEEYRAARAFHQKHSKEG